VPIQLYYKYSKLYLNSSISSIGYKYRLTPFSKILDILFPIIDIDKSKARPLSSQYHQTELGRRRKGKEQQQETPNIISRCSMC
jgi:hypothetical protein